MITHNIVMAESQDQSSVLSLGVGPELIKLRDKLPKLQHVDGAPLRALVVDDEPTLADLVAMGLTICGWDVKVANEGRAAVEEARTFHPQCSGAGLDASGNGRPRGSLQDSRLLTGCSFALPDGQGLGPR